MSRHKETPPAIHEGRPDTTADDRQTVPVSIPPRVDDDGEAWDDPQPLRETSSRAEFPTDALPHKVAEFVRSVARSIGVDEGVIGSMVLAVLSAATVGRVRVKAWGSLVERTVLWILIIAEPGERKTSVFSAARAPLEAVQDKLRAEAADGRRAAQGRLAAANAALKDAERDLAAAYAAADDPGADEGSAAAVEAATAKLDAAANRASELSVAALPRLIASDVTPEALHDLMAEQGSRLALFIPEGQSLLHRLANAGNGSDMEPYLAGHAGDTMYKDRVSRSVDPVEDPSLVIAVMTQPEVLSSKATDEMKWSGLMDRFLLVRPRSLAGTRSARAPQIDAFATIAYAQVIEQMVREFWPLTEPRLVGLTSEAEAIAVAFHDAVEPTLRAEVVWGGSAGWAKKMVGAMLRIAGTLAVAADPGATEISASQVGAAIRLIEYYEAHTSTVNRTLMDTALSDRITYTTRVLGALAKFHEKGATRVTAREVSRSLNKGRNDLSTQALHSLAELGWVIRDDTGANAGAWVLHPGLSQWADKYR